MLKLWGAYRHDDDPSIVFVRACASAPGGMFSAIRVGGRWKPARLTDGDLEDRYRGISDEGEVAALVKAARISLSDKPVMPSADPSETFAKVRQLFGPYLLSILISFFLTYL
jgi:hypothetical protein